MFWCTIYLLIYFNIFLEDTSAFCPKPQFWFSGDIGPVFQSPGLSSHLHASSPACKRFLRFNFGVTPDDLLVGSMAAESFYPYTCILILVGFLTVCDKDTVPNELCQLSSESFTYRPSGSHINDSRYPFNLILNLL